MIYQVQFHFQCPECTVKTKYFLGLPSEIHRLPIRVAPGFLSSSVATMRDKTSIIIKHYIVWTLFVSGSWLYPEDRSMKRHKIGNNIWTARHTFRFSLSRIALLNKSHPSTMTTLHRKILLKLPPWSSLARLPQVSSSQLVWHTSISY